MSKKQSTANGNAVATEQRFMPPSVLGAAGAVSAPNEEAEAFAEALEGQKWEQPPSVPVIKIDHRREAFAAAGELLPALDGYIVHFFQTRSYWEAVYTPGGHVPPVCWSTNAIASGSHVPMPAATCPHRQAEHCHICPQAEFGSAADGKGQRCRATTFVFLFNPRDLIPPVQALILPPSAIRSFFGSRFAPGYLQIAANFKRTHRHAPAKFYPLVWTRITLERGSDTHCVPRFEPVGQAEGKAEAAAIAQIRSQLMAAMEGMRGQAVTEMETEIGG